MNHRRLAIGRQVHIQLTRIRLILPRQLKSPQRVLRCTRGKTAMRNDFDSLGGHGGKKENSSELHEGESKRRKHS